MREVAVGDVHALLVPPRDHVALAEAMVRMLGDAELRGRLSAAARERARRRFDVRVAARRYEALYRELAPSARTGEAVRRVP
jgi:glycosyltransferase involved in cell wall biosynthesis